MSQWREDVAAAKRRPMPPARRKRIWAAYGEACGKCGVPVPLKGTTIDHIISLYGGGMDVDSNCWPLCQPCDAAKTYGPDAAKHAKIRRLRAREDGTRRERKPIPNRGFTRWRNFKNEIVWRDQ